MDHMQWDIAGPFPTSEGGFNYVLVFADVATRFVWLKLIASKVAEDVVDAMVSIITEFGVPAIVQSDNDKALVNQVTA
jgi:Integrase core domain